MNKTVSLGSSWFGSLFFLLLFVMKVLGIGVVATWSWWWITAPLWGPLVLVLLVGLTVFLAFCCFK